MLTHLRNLALILLMLLGITACKIDLSVVGLGGGKVDTISGSFHCDISNSDHISPGCTQYYKSTACCFAPKIDPLFSPKIDPPFSLAV